MNTKIKQGRSSPFIRLMVSLFNNSTKNFEINPGDRIAQFMLIPIILIDFDFVEEFEKTERASGGFGHSGTS